MAWAKGIKKRKNETEVQFFIRESKLMLEDFERELSYIKNNEPRTKIYEDYKESQIVETIKRVKTKLERLQKAESLDVRDRINFLLFEEYWYGTENLNRFKR